MGSNHPRSLEYIIVTPKGPQHGNLLLTDQEEQFLVWALQAFFHNNKALTLPLFTSLAFHLYGKRPSRRWSDRFFARHANALKPNATKQLCKARNKQELVQARVSTFIDQAEKFMKAHHFPVHAVFNYDETVLTLAGKKLSLKRIDSKIRSQMNSELTREFSLGSVISFIQASGSVFMSVFILEENF